MSFVVNTSVRYLTDLFCEIIFTDERRFYDFFLERE